MKRQSETPEAKTARLAKAAATRAETKARNAAYVAAQAAADKENRAVERKIQKLAEMTVERGATKAEDAAAQAASAKLKKRAPATAHDKVDARYRPPPLPAQLTRRKHTPL